jgi:cleavage stimulation factor subunit 2
MSALLRAQQNRSCSVFVGNIPYEVTEAELKQVFSAVGEVVSFRLMYDKNTKQPKGYGFCEYKDPETAYAAMRNLNNVECGGRPLRVDWADHELRATEGVMKQPGRMQVIDPALKQTRLKNKLLQEFHERLTDDTAEELSEDAKLHCDISVILSQWSTPVLFNVLGLMQRLVYESPDTARHLLTSSPQLALALTQTAYLLGLVAEPALPLSTADEIYAEHRINQLKNSRLAPAVPLGAAVPSRPAAFTTQAATSGAGGGGGGTSRFSEDEKRRLREELARMTYEQIAALPEDVKGLMREAGLM